MSTSSIDLTNSVLDVGAIVDSLIYVERAPARNMESQVSTLKSKVNAYQSLNTKMSALSDSINSLLYGDSGIPLTTPYSFFDRYSESLFSQCTATSSNDDAISATGSSGAMAGNYSITVGALAKAKSMASTNFADTTSAVIGTGTLTITTGSNDPVTVTIDSSNNTLSGVRDAINRADAGITATLINDGSSTPYRLLVTAKDTGTANAFTITDGLSGGQALGLTQIQAAADAAFVINGIGITKSTNSVSDVIDGVTFNLKQLTTDPVTISVEKDVDSIVEALGKLVTAYNAVNTFVSSQFTYNSTTETSGILAGDATLRRIQSALQSQITQSVSNQYTSYRVAGQVGLQFNRDGSLTLDEAKLRDALSDNFAGVAALFLGDGTPLGGTTVSDSRVSYNGKTSATQAGTYSIEISALAQQALAVGTQSVTTLSGNETLTITYGTASAVVALLQNDSLSTVLSKINTALSLESMAVTATDDGTGRIRIATNSYGSSQTITIASDIDGTTGTTGFGTSPMAANGIDISGTINGHAATGNGLTLTGAAGQPEEGLSLTISQTTTGSYGTVAVASGTEGVEGASILMNLYSVLDGITDPLSGPIHNATDGLNKNIGYLNDAISAFDERLEIRAAMLTAQFNQADQALRLLQVTQASLTSQLNSLSS